MKLSANHIEADIGFALEAGVDYIILDGRGGGTGAAPEMFRDHISVPTLSLIHISEPTRPNAPSRMPSYA